MFTGGAVFLSFETGADEDRAVLAIGEFIQERACPERSEGAFSQKSPAERLSAVEEHLKNQPTLVVWDNFESLFDDQVTAPALRAGILKLGARWAGLRGGSRLLVTSRQEEVEIPLAAKVELGGFSHRDALDFAAAILGKEGIDRATLDRDALQRLMELLGNHALSLALVLPKLKTMPLGKMLDEFEELLPGFKTGEGKKRDESLQVSLDFSLRRLGEETRRLLPALAVFQGGAHECNILQITQIPEEVWHTIRPELTRAALITVEELPGWNVPFIHFHPTLAPHLVRLLPSETRVQLETRYREVYYEFATHLFSYDSKMPMQARALAIREMPNLKCAFALTLSAGDAAKAVEFANSIVEFLDFFGRRRERDAIQEQVESQKSKVKIGSGNLTKAEFSLELRRGKTLLEQGNAIEAESLFRALHTRLEIGATYDTGTDIAGVLGEIGRCLHNQGKSAEFVEMYEKALEAYAKLSQSDEIAHKSGITHHDLASALLLSQRLDEAREHYEVALEIMNKVGDNRSIADTLVNLGTLAYARGDLVEAQQRYANALAVWRGLGDAPKEAIVWYQLGMVAEMAKNWDEAERYCRESLKIDEKIGNKAGVALTCNLLGVVVGQAERLKEAEQWFNRAIEFSEETGQVTAQP